MKYWVDGCIGKKHQENGRLAISHFKGVAFCFLMSLFFFFFVFLLLQVMEFGVLFFMECQRPYQMLVVKRYFLDFFCLVMHDLLMGEKKMFNEGRREIPNEEESQARWFSH